MMIRSIALRRLLSSRPTDSRYLRAVTKSASAHSRYFQTYQQPQPPNSSQAGILSPGAGLAVVAAAAAGAALSIGRDSRHALAEGSDGEQQLSLEDAQMADWDDFMVRSIKPGEDDDDDDDDDDGEEEEEGDGEDSGGSGEEDDEVSEVSDADKPGPADAAEDCSNGDGILVDDEQRNHLDRDPDDGGDEDAPSSQPGNGVQGPADDDEDTGPGYEAAAEDDPYANLPDEDEPTGCTICLINRRGPCRPHWRKFERCMKDHGEGGGGGEGTGGEVNVGGGGSRLAEMCDRYMLPWINCIQDHRNTYTLITNEFYQKEYVDALEDAVPMDDRILQRKVWAADENIDLSLWNEFVDKEKERQKKEMELTDEEVEEAVNLAKAYLKEKEEGGGTSAGEEAAKTEDGTTEGSEATAEIEWTEPYLITATAKVGLRDEISGLPIDIAYVRDQKGRLLGFEQFSNEKKQMRGEAEEGANGIPDLGNGVEGREDEASRKEIPTTGNCTFQIQPGETSSVRIFALYREEVPEEKVSSEGEGESEGQSTAEEKETPKVPEKLYYSQTIPLEAVGEVSEDAKKDEKWFTC